MSPQGEPLLQLMLPGARELAAQAPGVTAVGASLRTDKGIGTGLSSWPRRRAGLERVLQRCKRSCMGCTEC